jgi:hypothetical protein
MLARFSIDFSTRTAADLVSSLKLDNDDTRRSLRSVSDLFRRAAGGWEPATVRSEIGAAKAVATLTFTDNPTADETFILCGVTFTGRASGAVADEWNITTGGSAAADAAANAASVVATVNANTTVAACVIATSTLGVVTFTAIDPGAAGNGFVLTESLTNATRVQFASGSNGTEVTLAFL